MPLATKVEEYTTLVEARKACRLCPALVNPAVASGGQFDSDEIGPYTQWQGNLDAPLVVVAQDFADVTSFTERRGSPGEKVQTNLDLVRLLKEAGITVSPPRKDHPDDVLFFTNAVLCLKAGSMSAAVPARYFRNCGHAFLRRTVELVSPRAVVVLGKGALRAVTAAFDLPVDEPFAALVERSPSLLLASGLPLFAMYHPSRTVQNTARRWEEQQGDWRRLDAWLRSERAD